MPRVNIIKQVNVDGRLSLCSILRKPMGGYDWNALPDGRYYVEWHEKAKGRREDADATVAEAPRLRCLCRKAGASESSVT